MEKQQQQATIMSEKINNIIQEIVNSFSKLLLFLILFLFSAFLPHYCVLDYCINFIIIKSIYVNNKCKRLWIPKNREKRNFTMRWHKE